MKIRDLLKIVDKFTKCRIYIYLFKESLSESFLIFEIFFIRSIKDLLTIFPDLFVCNVCFSMAARFLSKS